MLLFGIICRCQRSGIAFKAVGGSGKQSNAEKLRILGHFQQFETQNMLTQDRVIRESPFSCHCRRASFVSSFALVRMHPAPTRNILKTNTIINTCTQYT